MIAPKTAASQLPSLAPWKKGYRPDKSPWLMKNAAKKLEQNGIQTDWNSTGLIGVAHEVCLFLGHDAFLNKEGSRWLLEHFIYNRITAENIESLVGPHFTENRPIRAKARHKAIRKAAKESERQAKKTKRAQRLSKHGKRTVVKDE